MAYLNRRLMKNTAVSMAQNSDALCLQNVNGYDVTAKITSSNPSNKTFDSGTVEVQTITFPAMSAATDGDYVVFYDYTGVAWAAAIDKFGLTLATPTGAAWTAIAAGRKAVVNCAADGTAEVQTITFPSKAGSTDADYIQFFDIRGRSWAIALDKNGDGLTPPTGALWAATDASRKAYVDISAATDAASVAALVETAMNALSGFGTYFTTDDTAADGTMLLTSDIKGNCTAPAVKNADDSGAGSITVSTSTPGVWATAAQVAARFETAIDALTDLSTFITTDDSAANGTMLFTQAVNGPTTNPIPKSFDDAGAGSITGVQTTAGVATEVDLDDDLVTIPSHGYLTGMKCTLTTTGTLPAGLATATDYYVIKIDDDTIGFASSQANALAGTFVDITDIGANASVNTVAVTATIAGSIKLQKNNAPDGLEKNWFDVTSGSQNFSAAGNLNWAVADANYNDVRLVVAVTSGTVTIDIDVTAKG